MGFNGRMPYAVCRMPSALRPRFVAPALARALRPVAAAGFLVAMLGQAWVLYAPHDGGPLPFPHADKLVHAMVFAAPAGCGVIAGWRARWVVGVLAVHAPVSELIQHLLLTGRQGDVLDVVADLAGVALGAWLGWRVRGAVPVGRRALAGGTRAGR